MSTYSFGNVNGPAHFGDHGQTQINHAHAHPDLPTMMDLTDRLIEALRAEYPELVPQGETIMAQFQESADDGLPPNRGRIRSALETIAIAASAGTGSLAYTQQLFSALGL
ncbi:MULTISPECIES: hypothetical protein [Streptomyces]|uniref:hypothetical protein n=1 Tax=Streptomyces TaxID=1883 RepID=UPI001670B1A2|nr:MULTISPECIES: hypothetical protein [Streptomyces]UFR01607.1 hypothetical protein KBP30_10605 [Streptomyces sp. Go40/10]GGS67613.1 hypothetical protein GCM10010206_32440 [Streptomyces cinerochromogenes]